MSGLLKSRREKKMDREKIVALHNSIMQKLEQALEGTDTKSFKPETITNPLASCLINSAIHDQVMLLAEINKGQK